jgi:hypothetical protein
MVKTKLLQEIENDKKNLSFDDCSLFKQKTTTNAKIVAEVGYFLVNMLRLWHSTVDCASFGLLSEVLLLISVLAPFWLLASLHWWWRWRLLPRCLGLAC